MIDIEELLAETFADPRRELAADSRQLAAYRARTRSLRVRRRLTVSVAAVAVAAIVAVVATQLGSPGRGSDVATAPASSAPATSTATITPPASALPAISVTPVDVANFSTSVDIALAGANLFDLATNESGVVLTRFAAATGLVLHQVTMTWGHGVAAKGQQPREILTNDSGTALWVWSQGASSTTIYSIEPDTLSVTRHLTVPGDTFAAAALSDDLWVATANGPAYRITSTGAPVEVPALRGAATIVADPARHVVLAGVDSRVVLFDPTTGSVTATGEVGLGKFSIAPTSTGVWVGGYDMTGSAAHKVLQLDPLTLNYLGTSDIDARIEAGAVVWPGQASVWVENNGGNVTCIDLGTGLMVSAPLAGATSRVLSANEFAYRLSEGTLQRLGLPAGCKG